jgi:hypothetical protein
VAQATAPSPSLAHGTTSAQAATPRPQATLGTAGAEAQRRASGATGADDEPSTQVFPNDDAPTLAEHPAHGSSLDEYFTPSRPRSEFDEEEAMLSILEHSGSHTLGESRPAGDSGPASLSSLSSPPSSLLPSFAREADSVKRWRRQRPVMRRLTIAAALALPLLLALQATIANRDLVAARWPITADALRAICAPLECSVRAPRALESLTVESSGLTRIDGTPLYRLQLAVRNRAAWTVAMPALDLTLTDSRGEVVSRRVFRAADLGDPAPDQLVSGAEWSVLATLDVGGRRVTGYAIDLFYP